MSEHAYRGGWHRAPRPLRIAGIAVAAVVGTAVFALAFGWLAMLLWNWLMPAIFHLGEITYWEGFGIVVLGKLIFGGFGFRGGGHGRGPWKGNPWGGSPWEGRRHGRDEWHLYREFWEQEGHKAFDAFVEKKKAETGPETRDA